MSARGRLLMGAAYLVAALVGVWAGDALFTALT
jgi:hypothetical protein